jgi:hypothetical protein
MKPSNLAAVWTPNLIRCESLQEELRMLATSQQFIQVLIELADDLFGYGDSDREDSTENDDETD